MLPPALLLQLGELSAWGGLSERLGYLMVIAGWGCRVYSPLTFPLCLSFPLPAGIWGASIPCPLELGGLNAGLWGEGIAKQPGCLMVRVGWGSGSGLPCLSFPLPAGLQWNLR